MSSRTPVSILIVNAHAEEIKLVTIGFRGFFSDCRVDVAYSAEEARTLLSAQALEWAFILVDEGCLSDPHGSLIEDLKRQAVYAVILLQSERSDAAVAIQAMQAGADFFLAKQSPAFLTELLFCAKEAVEKRNLILSATHSQIRHQQLLESLTDLYYELDAEGRFVALSANVTSLLGYAPQELIGSPYTAVLPPEQLATAHFRFNERRSGPRGAQRVALALKRKSTPAYPAGTIMVEMTARGLYDPHRRFLGTVGVLRDITPVGEELGAAKPLTLQAARLEEFRAKRAQVSALAQELSQPLAAVREETTRLLDAIRGAHIDERLTRLLEQLTAAATVQERLDRSLQSLPGDIAVETVNELLQEAISLLDSGAGPDGFLAELTPGLPPYSGNRTDAIEGFRLLFLHARTILSALGRKRRLLIRTTVLGPASDAVVPTLFPLPPPTKVTIEVLESDQHTSDEYQSAEGQETGDLAKLYALVTEIGGTLDIFLPNDGPLRFVLRLPIAAPVPSHRAAGPTPPLPSAAEAETVAAVLRQPPIPERVETADRRVSPRIVTTLPARVTVDSTAWDGTITDLSLGGANIALPSEFPRAHRQDVYAILRTAVGILELRGSAYVRPSPEVTDRASTVPTQLILEFQAPSPTEAAILASLIDSAREQTLAFSLDLHLTTEPQSPTPAGIASDQDQDDRRESVRVSLSLPVGLETEDLPEQGRLVARAENISRHGACLLVKGNSGRLRGSVLLHFASGKSAGHPGPHEPGVPDSSLPARIVWSAPDFSAPGELRPQPSDPAGRIGVRFLSLTPYAERELSRLVRQHLTSTQPVQAPSDDTSVISIHRECRNARGQAIAVADDHLRQPLPPDTPVVIIAPGYGQTAGDYVALSFYLALHRLRVLRYDHSNHVGLSEGELQNTTLRGMQTDLAKVIEFVQHTWPTGRIVVLASDLAARAALKMAVHHSPVDLLLLLNPVIDVGTLLMAVHGHDLVADYRYGLRRGIENLLGFNVNLDQFVGDMIGGRLTDLASTLEDIRLLRSPLAIVTSPQNESTPLPPSDLPHTFLTALSTQTRMLSIPSPLAGQHLSADEAPAAFRQIAEQIASILSWPLSAAGITASVRRTLLRQQRLELEQTRLQRNLSQISREAIALAHLQQLPQLANLHDYRKLLDDLYAFLAPLEPGMTIVDAGIGQSDVTRALLVNHAYRMRQKGIVPERPPLLIGLGRSEDQVYQAKSNVQTLQRELTSGKTGGVAALPPLTVGWMRTDWTQALPFASESIHRIVCNLSLSFVGSPRITLQEWCRVLHPEGRLVFTTFHPGTDLSTLYRRHLHLGHQDEFSSQAQPVLHYLGRLREAIRHGILHTFTQVALASLLHRAGALSFRVSPIFNGQAFVVIVGKRISSSSL